LDIVEEVNNLSEHIKFVRPVWVFAPDIDLDANALKELYQLDKLELLATGYENLDMTKLAGLSKLKTLYISNMDSSSLDQLRELPKGILSLHIIDSDLKDLDFLKGKSRIQELTVSGCEALADISAIKSLDNLQVLSLIDCDSIADLTPLHGLKELTWLSPPCNINDKELELIVQNSPGIESVDLCQCKNLNGLNAVKDLRKLSYLTLVETAIPTDSLVKFQDLKYLAYNTGQPGDSLNILRLQSQMPHTIVVAAEPFCMGTGWLLVFFVLMVMLALVSLGVKKRIRV
jgi:Leucine-rich repeat (LRR) protein